MRCKTMLVPFVASALVFGCGDPGSAPVVAPDLRAAQGDRSEWTLVLEYSVPDDEAIYGGFVACINGGLGENVYISGGPYRLYVKAVHTPSGNVINRGRIVADYERWVGEESGDLWISSLNATYNELTRAVDGHYLAHEPISQILTNEETGAKVRIQAMFWYELDELGNVVNKNARFGEVFACHTVK